MKEGRGMDNAPHCVWNGYIVIDRVGHSALFRSECYILLHSKKIMLHSFLDFLATYETQKNIMFFSILFRSFLKKGKERKERNVLL